MDYLIWGGAALTLTGVAGIAGTIIAVARARRAASDDVALKDRLMRILPWNLAALLVSCLGLMCVVIGVILG